MQITFFYTHDSKNSGGTTDAPDGTKENSTKYPEDPGTENRRIPDGGGPADGFLNEEGRNSGKGFLNHVDDSKDAATNHSKEEGSKENQG